MCPVKAALVAPVPDTAPGGDAMTVRHHRDTNAALLKRANVRRPIAWTIHPDEVVRFAAEGRHCETRRCRNPVAIATWRWWRSSEVGRVLLAEHLVCVEHGQEFAQRHHVKIESAPDTPSIGRGRPPAEGGSR
jgi:hypothetical protein